MSLVRLCWVACRSAERSRREAARRRCASGAHLCAQPAARRARQPRAAIMAAVASGDPMEEEPVEEEEAAAGGAAAAAAAAGPSKPMAGVQINRSAGQIKDSGAPQRATPFWICPECGNMLYPKEDKAARSLKRVCRHCHRESDADANLVFVNELHPTAKSVDAGSDMVKDPTLPHAKGVECPNCQHDEAVFFQAPMKGDAAMKLIFMCIKCAHRWLQ